MVEVQAIGLQLAIQRLFTGMPERRMSDVMDQRQSFDQLFIQFQGGGSGAGDLSDFNRMRESAAEVIGIAMSEHLRFSRKAAKGSRMNDTIAITLKSGAVSVGGFHMLAHSQGIGRISDHCAFAKRSCLHERVEKL